MNILRAEQFLNQYGSGDSRLSDVYDDDEMLQSALLTLFPDFEYPDFAYRTMNEIRSLYARNPRELVPAV